MAASQWRTTPLPDYRESLGDDCRSAYAICKEHEASLRKQSLKGQVALKHNLIRTRILGYLILHLPSDQARSDVAADTPLRERPKQISCPGGLLLPILHSTVVRPNTQDLSEYCSVAEYDAGKRAVIERLLEAPKSHATAESLALIRDGHRCVVTGCFDWEDFRSGSVSREEVKTCGLVITECAHIVPQWFFNNFPGGDEHAEKKQYADGVLTVLQRFGCDINKLNGPDVHNLHNVMTMSLTAHDFFDRLALWLEPQPSEPNTYLVMKQDPDLAVHVRGGGPCITLESAAVADDLDLPSPTLLELHAACCRVANLSGAADRLEELHCEMEATGVLAYDGGSAEVLRHALLNSLGSRGNDIGE